MYNAVVVHRHSIAFWFVSLSVGTSFLSKSIPLFRVREWEPKRFWLWWKRHRPRNRWSSPWVEIKLFESHWCIAWRKLWLSLKRCTRNDSKMPKNCAVAVSRVIWKRTSVWASWDQNYPRTNKYVGRTPSDWWLDSERNIRICLFISSRQILVFPEYFLVELRVMSLTFHFSREKDIVSIDLSREDGWQRDWWIHQWLAIENVNQFEFSF